MNRKELMKLMPRNKDDSARAEYIVSLGYSDVEPVIIEMLRWLRVDKSPVADIFLAFFSEHGIQSAKAVDKVLRSTGQGHLQYVIVTKVIPHWPRQAVEQVYSLNMLATWSGSPETALMSLEILVKHNLGKKDWLKGWLEFITERMERNAANARKIKAKYF